MTNYQEIYNELVTPTQEVVDACKRALEMRENSIISHNRILKVGDMYVTRHKKTREIYFTSNPVEALHFEPKKAEELRGAVTNGFGQGAEPAFDLDEYRAAIKKGEKTISELTAMLEKRLAEKEGA